MKRKKYLYAQTTAGRITYIGVDTLSTIEKYDTDDIITRIFDQTSDEEAPKAMTTLIETLCLGEVPEGNKKGIICNETGTYYRSVYEAAKSIGTSDTSFYLHLKGEKQYSNVRGLTFRRAG